MCLKASRRALGAAAWSIVSLVLAGCPSGVDVMPPADSAAVALKAGLESWKARGKPGAIEGQSRPVQFVDSVWQSGRGLREFAIESAESATGDRRYTVRLELASPDQTEEVRYVVIGTDPIWIYREADYNRMLNMEDNPTTGANGRRR
jgi:hypothetical protein